jgi:hypothetical protein
MLGTWSPYVELNLSLTLPSALDSLLRSNFLTVRLLIVMNEYISTRQPGDIASSDFRQRSATLSTEHTITDCQENTFPYGDQKAQSLQVGPTCEISGADVDTLTLADISSGDCDPLTIYEDDIVIA